jgi:hypothetical protein
MQSRRVPPGGASAGEPEGLGTMLSCDYNGWNDAPEEEREWFDQHPEIWLGPTPDPHPRTGRAAQRPRQSRPRGGMAA